MGRSASEGERFDVVEAYVFCVANHFVEYGSAACCFGVAVFEDVFEFGSTVRADFVGGDLARVEQPDRGGSRNVQDSCGLLRRYLRLGANDLDRRSVGHRLKRGEEAVERAVGDLYGSAAAAAEFHRFAVSDRVKCFAGEGLFGRTRHGPIVGSERNKRKTFPEGLCREVHAGAGLGRRLRGGAAYDCGIAMAFDSAPAPFPPIRRLTIDELAVAQGVQPMSSAEEWAGDFFESDEELETFLADLRASRASSLG